MSMVLFSTMASDSSRPLLSCIVAVFVIILLYFPPNLLLSPALILSLALSTVLLRHGGVPAGSDAARDKGREGSKCRPGKEPIQTALGGDRDDGASNDGFPPHSRDSGSGGETSPEGGFPAIGRRDSQENGSLPLDEAEEDGEGFIEIALGGRLNSEFEPEWESESGSEEENLIEINVSSTENMREIQSIVRNRSIGNSG